MKYLHCLAIFCTVFIVSAHVSSQTFTITFSQDYIDYHKQDSWDLIYYDGNEPMDDLSMFEDCDIFGSGKPSLPSVGLAFILPFGRKAVSVSILHTEQDTLDGEWNLIPQQAPEIIGTNEDDFIGPDTDIYSSDELFPFMQVEITSVGCSRGSSIFRVIILPIQYIPVHKKLVINTSITFKVNTESYDCVIPQVITQERLDENIKRLENLVYNKEDVEEYVARPPLVSGIDTRCDATDCITNFPNPFNPVTSFNYTTISTGHVTIEVYAITGQKVATLVDQILQSGEYTVQFDGTGLPGGIYLYRFASPGYTDTGKILLLK